MVYITEGGESSVFYIRTQDGAVETPLPFTIKVSKFVYEQFADGRPKDYRSALEVSSGGIRKAAEIQVNTPLSFMGYGIHQSSFKPDFERSSYVVEFEQRGKAERVTGAGRVGQVIRTAVPVDAEYSLIGAEADLGGFGPAVRISRKAAEGEPLEFWLFSKYAGFDRKHRNAEWALSIKSEKPAFMTGLQITRDPGSSLVFIGCALMLLGLVAAFYMSHRQVWLKEEGGRLIVAASASKNPKAMDAAVERFMVELKKEAGCT
jgi:cytochrome c biogenesis protein